MFGMLSRLDRMVIRETLRSVGYTLAVVLVLSVFGAALRPLGRGDFLVVEQLLVLRLVVF